MLSRADLRSWMRVRVQTNPSGPISLGTITRARYQGHPSVREELKGCALVRFDNGSHQWLHLNHLTKLDPGEET